MDNKSINTLKDILNDSNNQASTKERQLLRDIIDRAIAVQSNNDFLNNLSKDKSFVIKLDSSSNSEQDLQNLLQNEPDLQDGYSINDFMNSSSQSNNVSNTASIKSSASNKSGPYAKYNFPDDSLLLEDDNVDLLYLNSEDLWNDTASDTSSINVNDLEGDTNISMQNVSKSDTVMNPLKGLSKDQLIDLFIHGTFKYDESATRILWFNFIDKYLPSFIDIFKEIKTIDNQIANKVGLGKMIDDIQATKDSNIDNWIAKSPQNLSEYIDNLMLLANYLYGLYNKIISLMKDLDNDETYQAYLNNDLFSIDKLEEKLNEIQGQMSQNM